jgi:hypothetical protein
MSSIPIGFFTESGREPVANSDDLFTEHFASDNTHDELINVRSHRGIQFALLRQTILKGKLRVGLVRKVNREILNAGKNSRLVAGAILESAVDLFRVACVCVCVCECVCVRVCVCASVDGT